MINYKVKIENREKQIENLLLEKAKGERLSCCLGIVISIPIALVLWLIIFYLLGII